MYAGPISTRYGEVFWRGLPPAPVPAEIQKRFDGKVIAITGYEQDQVIRHDMNDSSKDQSVPIYWAQAVAGAEANSPRSARKNR